MKSSFGKDVFSVGLSKGGIILSGLMTSIITARVLGPDNNGVIAALLVYPSLFMAIGSLGIRQSTTYFLGKKIYSENEIKTAITQIWMLSTVFSVSVCFVLMTYFSKSGDNLLLVGLALLPIPFSLFNTYNSGVFLGKNEIGAFNKINWIPAVVMLVSTFLLVYMLSLGVAGFLIAAVLGPLVISAILLFKNKFITAFSTSCNWEIVSKMLKLGLSYALALFIINLNYKMDVILIDNLSTSYQTGIYSKGASITQYLWQIPMLLSTVVFARSAVAKDDLKFSYKVVQLLRLSIIAVGVGAFSLYLLSKPLIITMYGVAFSGSIPVLKLLIPGVLLLTIFKVMNTDLAGKGKPWVSVKAMLPALLINVILNVVWIPEYGANGAAAASTISYSMAALLFLYFYSKEVKIPIKEIFRYRRKDFKPILNIINRLR